MAALVSYAKNALYLSVHKIVWKKIWKMYKGHSFKSIEFCSILKSFPAAPTYEKLLIIIFRILIWVRSVNFICVAIYFLLKPKETSP